MARLPVFFKELTPELQRKAEVELGETPAVKERAVRELRSLVNAQEDIKSRQDDLFLLRFLRAKKYDVQKSFNVLRNYYAMRAKQRGIIVGIKPSKLKHVLEMNNVGYGPYRLPSGSHIGICLIGRHDLTKASVEDLAAVTFLMGELSLECEVAQICGGANVVDMKGMSFMHYVKFLTIPFISLCISVVQDCWPERFHSIHFVNEPFFLHTLHRLFRPLLKQKLNERFYFHGSDLSSLHAHIPKDLLPQELGGTLGPTKSTELTNYILSKEAYIESINKYGVIGKTSEQKDVFVSYR